MSETFCGILLAAGMGSRLRPLTHVRPKALIPLFGIPLAAYGLRMLAKAGCRHVGVNLHHLGEQLEAWLPGECRALGMELSMFPEPELLGTGGGLARMFRELPAGPCLVMNADIVHNLPLRSFLVATEASCLALLSWGQPHALKVLDGRVLKVGASREANVGFTGISRWSQEARSQLIASGCRHVTDYWRDRLSEGGRIQAWNAPGDILWEDLGHAHRYLELHSRLWKRHEFQDLCLELELSPVWDCERELCLPRGSLVTGRARRSVIWDAVEWNGSLESAVLCDGVRGDGCAKNEMIL